jgi:hypothetical protein
MLRPHRAKLRLGQKLRPHGVEAETIRIEAEATLDRDRG